MSDFIDAEVITVFEKGKKYPRPIRFRFAETEEDTIVVNVDRISQFDVRHPQSDPVCVYKCESVIDNILCRYELNYRQMSNAWHIRIN